MLSRNQQVADDTFTSPIHRQEKLLLPGNQLREVQPEYAGTTAPVLFYGTGNGKQ